MRLRRRRPYAVTGDRAARPQYRGPARRALRRAEPEAGQCGGPVGGDGLSGLR
jgi:hypothetical protein